jgi:hypothetical protein
LNQGMTMTNNETEQHKTQRLGGYEAWQARALNRQVLKLAIFSLLGVGLLLWLAQGIGNGPPNDHLRPDAEFWGAYGTAVNGILGTVFTGVGAVFGIMIATLGLINSKQAHERDGAIFIRDTLERSLEPFVAVGLATRQLFRLARAYPASRSKIERVLLWVELRALASKCATTEVNDMDQSEGQRALFEQIYAYVLQHPSRPALSEGLSFESAPLEVDDCLEVPKLQECIRQIRSGILKIEQSPSSLLFGIAAEPGLPADLGWLRDWLDGVERRWASASRDDVESVTKLARSWAAIAEFTRSYHAKEITHIGFREAWDYFDDGRSSYRRTHRALRAATFSRVKLHAAIDRVLGLAPGRRTEAERAMLSLYGDLTAEADPFFLDGDVVEQTEPVRSEPRELWRQMGLATSLFDDLQSLYATRANRDEPGRLDA